MTNEQEVIEYLKKQIEICNENADICDKNDFDEEATYLRKQQYMFETALKMIKEKDKEIAKYEKIYKEYDCYRWVKELEKKDKIIDLMTEYLWDNDTSIAHYLYRENGNCDKEMIKQYFERKVK